MRRPPGQEVAPRHDRLARGGAEYVMQRWCGGGLGRPEILADESGNSRRDLRLRHRRQIAALTKRGCVGAEHGDPDVAGTRLPDTVIFPVDRTAAATVIAGEDKRGLAPVGWQRLHLAPQIADMIASEGGEAALKSHRREITVLFCDLRGFTAFSETSEPEDLMGVLREYHEVIGELIFLHQGTLERFAGDAIMVFFNDPVLQEDHCARAVRLGLDIRAAFAGLLEKWQRRGFKLGLGIGIAAGYATLGRIGFAKRFDYAAIGTVTNLAARLCGDASAGQILLSQRVASSIDGVATARLLAEKVLKGLHATVPVYEICDPASAAAATLPVKDDKASDHV